MSRSPDGEPEREDRGAVIALVAIVAISLGWWWLALWPIEPGTAAWLARTRAACFGATPNGLPDAGGWVLLIGEPLGMLGTLVVLYGRALRRDLASLARRRMLRSLLVAACGASVVVVAVIGVRLLRARDAVAAPTSGAPSLTRVDQSPPSASLVDQHGRVTTLASLGERPSLVAFAYGHCASVCPAVVHELLLARAAAHREDVPILVVTLDPWRDTPDRLETLATEWRLGRRDRALSGDVDAVERVLDAIGIGRRRNETTGDVDHASTALLIDERGRIAWRADGGPRALARLVSKL